MFLSFMIIQKGYKEKMDIDNIIKRIDKMSKEKYLQKSA